MCQRKFSVFHITFKTDDKLFEMNWKYIFKVPSVYCWYAVEVVPGQTATSHANNRYLYTRKVISRPCVLSRGQEKETTRQLFRQCQISLNFFNELERLMDYNCAHNCNHCSNLTFSQELILFGCTQNTTTNQHTDLFSYLQSFKIAEFTPVLNVFQFVWKCRCNIEKYGWGQSGTLSNLMTGYHTKPWLCTKRC